MKQKKRRGSRIAIAFKGVRHDNVFNIARLSPVFKFLNNRYLNVMEIATAYKNYSFSNISEARQRLAFFSFLVTFFFFCRSTKKKKVIRETTPQA